MPRKKSAPLARATAGVRGTTTLASRATASAATRLDLSRREFERAPLHLEREEKEREDEGSDEDKANTVHFDDAEPSSPDVDCSSFSSERFLAVAELRLRERFGAASWAFCKVFVPDEREAPLMLFDGLGVDERGIACSWPSMISNRQKSVSWVAGERRNIAVAVHALARSGHLRIKHCVPEPGSGEAGVLRVYLGRAFCQGRADEMSYR